MEDRRSDAMWDRWESESGYRRITVEDMDTTLSQPGAIDLRTDEQRRRDTDEIRRRHQLGDQQ